MKRLVPLLATLLFILLSICSSAQIEIVLRKSFIDSFKTRVTISSDFLIAHAHERPNTPSKDGDLHFSGSDDKIGLPMVAEIMNARSHTTAVNVVHNFEGTANPATVIGVWRIWCEHAGESSQQQGGGFPPIEDTNPDHVFEIHPVTKINTTNLTSSLKPITGFTYKVAEDAFFRYSNARCKIIPNGDMVTIETNGVGFNYVKFIIEVIDDDQLEVDDGRFVFCRVRSLDGELISQKMRMVFAKGSPPEVRIKNMDRGDQMTVVGVPRLNLSLVSFRVNNSASNPNMLEWNLPVEMIIVGAFPNQQ